MSPSNVLFLNAAVATARDARPKDPIAKPVVVTPKQPPPAGLYRVSTEKDHIVLQPLRGALSRNEAMAYLGCASTKLWELVRLGKIGRTEYGKYPIEELDRYLSENTIREET